MILNCKVYLYYEIEIENMVGFTQIWFDKLSAMKVLHLKWLQWFGIAFADIEFNTG